MGGVEIPTCEFSATVLTVVSMVHKGSSEAFPMVVILQVSCHVEHKATSSATVVARVLLASTPRYPPNPGCCHYPILLSCPFVNSFP